MTEDDNNIFYSGILTGLKCAKKLFTASNDDADEFFLGLKGAIKVLEISTGVVYSNDNNSDENT